MRWRLSRLSSHFDAKSSRERKPKWLSFPWCCFSAAAVADEWSYAAFSRPSVLSSSSQHLLRVSSPVSEPQWRWCVVSWTSRTTGDNCKQHSTTIYTDILRHCEHAVLARWKIAHTESMEMGQWQDISRYLCAYGQLLVEFVDYCWSHLTIRTRSSANAIRRQRGRCRNIKGEPKYLRASLAQGYAHFSSGCGFMAGLGKSKQCTKFEVASFSHCANIEGNSQILESTPSPGPCLPFLLCVIFIMGLGKS